MLLGPSGKGVYTGRAIASEELSMVSGTWFRVVLSVGYMLIACGGVARSSAAQPVLTVPTTLEERCTGSDDAQSCYELGLLYYRSSGTENRAKGMGWIKKGCYLEMSTDCSEHQALDRAKAAESVRFKLDADIDNKKREVLQGEMTKEEIACWDGKAEDCGKSGTYYQFIAIPTDPKKALDLFVEGCRLGDKSSCDSLSLIKKGLVHVYNVDP